MVAQLGRTGLQPGRTGLQPGRTGLQPGRTGLQPGRTGLQPGRTRHECPHLVDWRVREAVGAQVVRPLDRRRRVLVTALAAEPLPAVLREVQALHCLGVAHVAELARVLVEEKALAQLVPAELGQLAVLRTEVLDRPRVETAEYMHMQCACTSADRVHAPVHAQRRVWEFDSARWDAHLCAQPLAQQALAKASRAGRSFSCGLDLGPWTTRAPRVVLDP